MTSACSGSRLGPLKLRHPSPLGPAPSHCPLDDPRHPVRSEHHLLPREAQHEPPPRHELVVALAVATEGDALAVELVAVGLEHELKAGLAEIDLREEVVIADAVLGIPSRAL